MKTIDIADVERGSSDIKSPARLALAQTGSPHEDEPLEQQTTHKRKLAETESGEEDKVIPQSSPPREEQIQQLKDNKIATIKAKIEQLQQRVADTKERVEKGKSGLRHKDAAATVKAHIKLLHRYNEMRDIGQGLIGLVADQRNVAIREVYKEYGIGNKD